MTTKKKISKTSKKGNKPPVNKPSVKKPMVRKHSIKVIGESSVMDKLLKKHEAEVKSYSQGDKVKGTVIEILPKRVVIDIGGKNDMRTRGITKSQINNDFRMFADWQNILLL